MSHYTPAPIGSSTQSREELPSYDIMKHMPSGTTLDEMPDKRFVELYHKIINKKENSSPEDPSKHYTGEEKETEAFSEYKNCACSSNKGDELMMKLYMGGMSAVGLFILYRLLQK